MKDPSSEYPQGITFVLSQCPSASWIASGLVSMVYAFIYVSMCGRKAWRVVCRWGGKVNVSDITKGWGLQVESSRASTE